MPVLWKRGTGGVVDMERRGTAVACGDLRGRVGGVLDLVGTVAESAGRK